jgi:O-methyltransferase
MKNDQAPLRDAYLDLLRDVLTNVIYRDGPIVRLRRGHRKRRRATLPRRMLNRFRQMFRAPPPQKPKAEPAARHDPALREVGRDWPSSAHSMIGTRRMQNLRELCEAVISEGVPGDFIETGVWRGGACIMMRAILKAYGDTTRTIWVADSFEGLPKPDAGKYAADEGDRHHTHPELAISMEQVQDNFRAYGLLDSQVRFLKGWFRDTLPAAPIEKLAILRLDGDMYESTMDGFVNLYHKVSPGGYVIVDDYYAVPACKTATQDFLDARGLADQVEIKEIDGMGVYWQIPR